MKRVLVVIVWVGATLASGALAWGVVGLAGDQVSEPAVVPLSADQVATLVPAPPDADGGAPEAPAETVPAVVTTLPEAPAVPSTPPSTEVTTTTAPDSGETLPTSTSTPETVTTTTVPTATTTTTEAAAPAAEPEVGVYRMPGGTVVVRYTAEWVEFVSATPEQGYGVDVEHAGPDRVEVEFDGTDGETTFRAEVRDGELVTEIETED